VANTQLATAAEGGSYKRLTREDHEAIVKMHDAGMTLTAIAQQLNRSVSTIHEVVKIYKPTVDLAKRKLAGAALQMAENIVTNGLPRDHVQVLNGLGVLNQQDTGKLTLIINGLTLHGTGKPEAIDGEVLSPHQLEAGSESAENT
jgi:hypothetical protein